MLSITLWVIAAGVTALVILLVLIAGEELRIERERA